MAKEIIGQHLAIVTRLIADTNYHFTNLEYLSKLDDESKKIVNGFMVLSNYRSLLWYLVVLDLNKLLNKKGTDKFNLWKLINLTRENQKKLFWHKPVDLNQLNSLENKLILLEQQIAKLTEIRDQHIAHFDNKEVHFIISLSELFELIALCLEIRNKISHWFNDTTLEWAYPELNMINPVINNLRRYSQVRKLFFDNHRANKRQIEMLELSKIIRPQAKYEQG